MELLCGRNENNFPFLLFFRIPFCRQTKRRRKMYEITYDDKEMLTDYIGKRMAYDGGIYDLTFENRYLI